MHVDNLGSMHSPPALHKTSLFEIHFHLEHCTPDRNLYFTRYCVTPYNMLTTACDFDGMVSELNAPISI